MRAVKAAAAILVDKAKYTADTIKAIEKYEAMLNQAIASGTAGDVTRCAQYLQKAVEDAELKAANPMTVKAKTVKAKAKKKLNIKDLIVMFTKHVICKLQSHMVIGSI